MDRTLLALFSELFAALGILVFAGAVLAQEQIIESRYNESYPQAASKKGLQVELLDDALALGVKHAVLNVNLAQLVSPGDKEVGIAGRPHWALGNQEFFFNPAYLERLDRNVRTLSDGGVLVHLIILVYESSDPTVNRILLHPDYDYQAPNHLGAFNNRTDEGRSWLTATMEFLAEHWSRSDQKYGRVAGYIIGNEVNSHWFWSNCGRASMEDFTDDYLQTVRIAHRAIRRQASWPRVYVSLDHHWNIRYPGGDSSQTFAGKDFIDYFARRARELAGGDFDWHVAYHPYPENLFEPRFWNDKTAISREDSPRITFKNLSVLTDYIEREELLYQGKPRRIILSEQGFHSARNPDGETIQAAAYCYAYRTVEQLDGVDAFILHRHVDHAEEGGLNLGLRRRAPGAVDKYPKKRIYECFRLADTPDWRSAFEFALPIVGISSWNEP